MTWATFYRRKIPSVKVTSVDTDGNAAESSEHGSDSDMEDE